MAFNRAQRRIAKLPTDVYRVFDAEHQLLYVGCSVNVFARMREHKKYARWWTSANHATVQTYADRYTARYAEAVAIRDEKPRFNTVNEWAPAEWSMPAADETFSLFWEAGEVWVDAS